GNGRCGATWTHPHPMPTSTTAGSVADSESLMTGSLRNPADFGGACLAGECSFDAELLLPHTSYFGLQKVGSYLYGTWRDEDGNLLRALRGITADSSRMGWAFRSGPGRQLDHDEDAERRMWRGAVSTGRTGDVVTFANAGEGAGGELRYRHEPDGC